MNSKKPERPVNEYGPWFVNEQGDTVRTVTRWVKSIMFPDEWIPVVDIEKLKDHE